MKCFRNPKLTYTDACIASVVRDSEMSRPKDLPEFDNPPVVETVLSVQFEKLNEMRVGHFGLFWSQIKSRFPHTEERGTLEASIEAFPPKPGRGVGIKVESYERPPLPRVWFVSDDGNSLIQLQSDRLIRNWRKVGAGDAYPRYETVRQSFQEDFDHFLSFTRSNGLGEPSVNQCEITYVNHIVAGEGWSGLSEFEKVFRFLRSPESLVPGAPEDVSSHTRFQISDDQGRPVGRLHVELQPGIQKTDQAPLYRFSLTARGLIGNGLDFFDLGRDWIVRSFTELTTTEMHRIWKRRA